MKYVLVTFFTLIFHIILAGIALSIFTYIGTNNYTDEKLITMSGIVLSKENFQQCTLLVALTVFIYLAQMRLNVLLGYRRLAIADGMLAVGIISFLCVNLACFFAAFFIACYTLMLIWKFNIPNWD